MYILFNEIIWLKKKEQLRTSKYQTDNTTKTDNSLSTNSSIDKFVLIFDDHALGSMINVCILLSCHTFYWNGKTSMMCCHNGKITFAPSTEPRQQLLQLWSKPQFLLNIRLYNSIFVFTSMEEIIQVNVVLVERYANARDGVYTFNIQVAYVIELEDYFTFESK